MYPQVKIAKQIAKEVGIKGAQGGWIYSTAGGTWTPICQGWLSFADVCIKRGLIFKMLDGSYIRSNGSAHNAFGIY